MILEKQVRGEEKEVGEGGGERERGKERRGAGEREESAEENGGRRRRRSDSSRTRSFGSKPAKAPGAASSGDAP